MLVPLKVSSSKKKKPYVHPFKRSVMQVQEYGTAKAVSTWQRAGVEPADVVGSSGWEEHWT